MTVQQLIDRLEKALADDGSAARSPNSIPRLRVRLAGITGQNSNADDLRELIAARIETEQAVRAFDEALGDAYRDETGTDSDEWQALDDRHRDSIQALRDLAADL